VPGLFLVNILPRAQFERLQFLSKEYDLVQIIEAAGGVLLTETVASFKDVAERKGRAFVFNQIIELARTFRLLIITG